jgi:hypothetical protein
MKRLCERVARYLQSKGQYRMITRDGESYLERFYILSTKWFGIYLHRFWSSDEDGLHDHPWHSVSILLSGSYLEEEPERQGVPSGPTVIRRRSPMKPPVKFRSKYAAHRITVPDDTEGQCWSLFLRFGLKRRDWGFYGQPQWVAAHVQSRRDFEQAPELVK